MRKFSVLSAFALLLSGLAGGACADWGDWLGGGEEAKEVFERTVDLGDGGSLSLDNTNGGITVRAWDRQEVKIWAEKKARAGSEADAREILEETEIRIDTSAGAVDIETRLPRKLLGGRRQASVKYELTVPRRVALDLLSTNGGIRVEGTEGEVEAETTNGGIHIEDVGGDVEAHTTNGGIKAYRVRGMVAARTTNGGISAEMGAGTLAEDLSFTTTNGSVELSLDPGLAARIEARATNGRVSSDFTPPEGQRSKKRLEMDLNGGGPVIKLTTTNGSIRLREM